MTNANETRKYRVIAEGTRGKTVTVVGDFGSDQAWRDEAARLSGVKVDASYDAERVIRLFPWWMQ